MSKIIRRIVTSFLVSIIALVLCAAVLYFSQGPSPADYSRFASSLSTTTSITIDDDGIPTIKADNWKSLITAQGYVVASERMWQMDLMRRKMAGRLAEWFGEAALESDRRMRTGNFTQVTEAAVDQLIPEERVDCEAFATGVNQYIAEHPWTVGFEYILLRARAEPWSCKDSLLVLVAMAHELSSTYDSDVESQVWRSHMSPGWEVFLGTQDHPWNIPLIGPRGPSRPQLPPAREFFPQAPLLESESAVVRFPIGRKGSNNWGYHGKKGYFLCNDPHLGTSVPQLFYAMRLFVNESQWVVGVALPGLPGITLGMNQSFAWAFTNLGEDVDDVTEETINLADETFLVDPKARPQEWRALKKIEHRIKVKGKADDIYVTYATNRGPVYRDIPYSSGKAYSRQWLAMQPEHLHVSAAAINRAKDWDGFNVALNFMHLPAQNVLFMNRQGDIGYRASGIGIRRSVSGAFPHSAGDSEWLGFDSTDNRPRLLKKAAAKKDASFFIGTANERMWVDPFPQNWFGDDRFERIHRYLGEREDYDMEDMQRLFYDTQSRFLLEFGQWFAKNARVLGGPLADSLASQFESWKGYAATDPKIFTDALFLEKEMRAILQGRLGKQFFKEGEKYPRFYSSFERAILLSMFSDESYARAFGTTSQDLVRYLLKQYAALRTEGTYQDDNRWKSQHPFVGRVPLLGNLLKVEEFKQNGFEGVVRTERSRVGPSMRLGWDLQHPEKSLWTFPIGQSGHGASKYFKNFQPRWIREESVMTAVPKEWVK